MLGGCGGSGEKRSTKDNFGVAGKPVTATRTSHGYTVKVYAVGSDIEPGIYTTTSVGCAAVAASDVDFDIESSSSDGYLRSSAQVGNVQRIKLNSGEFFQVQGCAQWRREDGTAPATADPSTLAGGCAILFGPDRLLERTAALRAKPVGRTGTELQEKLFSIVVARNRKLMDPAGQLVDFLDDVPGYVEHGRPDSQVAGAIAAIRAACAKP